MEQSHFNQEYDSKSSSFDEADFWRSMGVHEPTCFFGRVRTASFLKTYSIFSCLLGVYWMFQTRGTSNREMSFIFENFWFYAICTAFPAIGCVGLCLKKKGALVVYGMYALCGLVLMALLGGTAVAVIMKDDFCFRLGEHLEWDDDFLSNCIEQTLMIRIIVTATTILAVSWQIFILYSIQKCHDYLYRTSWTAIPQGRYDLAM